MENENRNFTIGTAMLRAFPAVIFGVLAVPLMAAQDQDDAAHSQPATSAQDQAAPNAERTVGAGQITEILKRQGSPEPTPDGASSRTDAIWSRVKNKSFADAPENQAPENPAPTTKFKPGKSLADTVKRDGNEAQPQACQSTPSGDASAAEICPADAPDTRSGK